jgi:membrane fusion protein (multidrug efflux system)
MKKWIFRGLVILLMLAGGGYATFFLIHSISHESVDNAYVAGTIVPIAAEIRGKVEKVYIGDNQHVSVGTPLLSIVRDDFNSVLQERKEAIARLMSEDREIRASVEEKKRAITQARANFNAAIAEENLMAKEVERYGSLYKEELVSQSQFDRAESAYIVAHARKEAAAAAVDGAETAIETLQARLETQNFRVREAQVARQLAQLDLTRTTISAPISGRVAVKNVDPGKYVQPGQTLLSIVKEDTWVIANFKETQIEKMSVGQPVEVKVDAYPGVIFKGHIDSLQAGTGAVFSLLPPENATGNFVKVVQRVPVKIVLDSQFDPGHPLWPGMSVVPTVDTSRRIGPKLASN